MAFAVIAQGKVLLQRDLETRVEYEADTLSRYYDYLPVLRAQREEVPYLRVFFFFRFPRLAYGILMEEKSLKITEVPISKE